MQLEGSRRRENEEEMRMQGLAGGGKKAMEERVRCF